MRLASRGVGPSDDVVDDISVAHRHGITGREDRCLLICMPTKWAGPTSRRRKTSTDQPQMTSAELNAVLAAHGTSAEQLDSYFIELTVRLMEKVGRPVQEDEIADYINECEPQLLALLELIDDVRHREACARRGRRLTEEQRAEVMTMIVAGVPIGTIAERFGVSRAAIYPYRNRGRAAQG